MIIIQNSSASLAHNIPKERGITVTPYPWATADVLTVTHCHMFAKTMVQVDHSHRGPATQHDTCLLPVQTISKSTFLLV